MFVPPFGEQRHKGCVHSFLWIFECCPRVKLNNKNAAYLDLILLIFIELVFFFFPKFGLGSVPLREMTTVRDGSRPFVTHLRALV